MHTFSLHTLSGVRRNVIMGSVVAPSKVFFFADFSLFVEGGTFAEKVLMHFKWSLDSYFYCLSITLRAGTITFFTLGNNKLVRLSLSAVV
jgi:hypothetical protein